MAVGELQDWSRVASGVDEQGGPSLRAVRALSGISEYELEVGR